MKLPGESSKALAQTMTVWSGTANKGKGRQMALYQTKELLQSEGRMHRTGQHICNLRHWVSNTYTDPRQKHWFQTDLPLTSVLRRLPNAHLRPSQVEV